MYVAMFLFLELEGELKSKNTTLQEVEGKYTTSRALAEQSAKGFSALGVIIQYYLQQVSVCSNILPQ